VRGEPLVVARLSHGRRDVRRRRGHTTRLDALDVLTRERRTTDAYLEAEIGHDEPSMDTSRTEWLAWSRFVFSAIVNGIGWGVDCA